MKWSTQSQWHEFNDMEYLVKKLHGNMSWKDCHVECATLFHSHVDMFMHQYIFNNDEILGKIKKYVINYELQHHGSVHAHIILWVHEYDLERITNEIVTFLLAMFDEISTKFTPPK
jgi:hypothetical protein